MSTVIVCSRHESHKNFNFGDKSKTVRVRFGAVKQYPKKDVDFPSPEAISNTKNKLTMKRIFRRAKVASSNFVTNCGLARWLPNRMIASGRPLVFKKLEHSRGEGLKVLFTKEEIKQAWKGDKGYFEELKPCQREFRTHVCSGKIIHIDEKLPKTPGNKSLVKNLDNGYKYVEVKNVPQEIMDESIKAVSALRLDFGVVDIGLMHKSPVVFEVNTAFGLRTKTKEVWQKNLNDLIDEKIKEKN